MKKHRQVKLTSTIKTKQKKGPLKTLRPINLLNLLNKILSVITLNRTQEKVEQYLSASQAVYRPKQSTGDIVWAHRFIIGKVQLYQDLVHITGIDVFNIQHNEQTKINGERREIETNIASPQGKCHK